MKLRPRQNQQVTVKNQLKIRLILIGSAFALAALVGVGIFIWLNIGAPEKVVAAPTSLSGVINSYLRVTALSTRTFTATNLSGSISDFSVGKTIMVYQVKGATITVSNTSSYGTVTALNNAGLYEFAVVSAFSGSGPYTITVASLVNSYTVSGAVQLISVPTYTDATVSGTVTSTPWDATLGRGGVVAMQVSNDLTLGANITVAGQGFKGGVASGSDDGCPDNTTYKSPSTDYGAKGESISTDGSLYGIGAQATGGGGGNPHNAGGGGGGNHTYGGNGGRGYQPGGSCSVINAGGKGGKAVTYTSTSGRIFFGGGGGSGQQNDALASSGGNGGGIIIVRAKTVKSSCGGTYGFIADGGDASNTGGNDGAGGGGAGGVIELDVKAYALTCNILVRADGGNGGSVSDASSHGGGSGGGIGVILEITPSSTSNVTMVSTVGTIGRDCSGCTTNTATTPGPVTSSKITSSSAIPGTGVIVMPVKLLSFSGIASGRDVELNWVTATEVNNRYFTVQRSADGITFDSVGTVEGSGNSVKQIKYAYTDSDVPGTAAYYRLKQTDYDGTTSLSKIIYVILQERSEDETVSIYPNPASDQVTIKADGLTEVRIVNQQGAVLYSRSVTDAEHTVDVSTIANGMYLVEVVARGKKTVKKLVIKH